MVILESLAMKCTFWPDMAMNLKQGDTWVTSLLASHCYALIFIIFARLLMFKEYETIRCCRRFMTYITGPNTDKSIYGFRYKAFEENIYKL